MREPALVLGFHKADRVMKRETVKFVREGKYGAEVPVVLIEDDTGWSPYLSVEDATKL